MDLKMEDRGIRKRQRGRILATWDCWENSVAVRLVWEGEP